MSEALQRRFWDPFYDRWAGFYDVLVNWLTLGVTQRLRRRALAYLPAEGDRVLEIGFGSGRLHHELAERYELAGLDLAPGMAHRPRRRLTRHDLHSALCVANAYAIPWPEESFDAVLSTFAFSAIPDGGRALDEMIRVTRPGGRVIIVDAGEAPNGNLPAHLLASLWAALGDFIRDEVPLMEARGLTVERAAYGPWGCVHVVVGQRPA